MASDDTPSDGLAGLYYDGRSSRSHAVRVRREADSVHVESSEVSLRVPAAECRLEPRLGSAARRLLLPAGASVELADSPAVEALFGAPRGRWLDRMESRWSLAVGSLVAIALVCVAAYLWLLPWGANVASHLVPQSWQQTLSSTTLAALDKVDFTESQLPKARQQQIERKFANWLQDGSHASYRLLFRKSGKFGANAFALPGGDIVLLDGLVEDAHSDDEVLGVLAHELGHVERRHAMRQLIQGSAVSVAAAMWFGDISALAAASTALVSMHYSRDFEREADDYAATIMLANGVDPRKLGAFLQRLTAEDDRGSHEADNATAYLSSHPLTSERMDNLDRRARDAGFSGQKP
ncbi:M48 family metallopeptidase [Uliginosibacterium sp. sgz301328]|uniref:M48 family metallopeptidase n=1 Tax=Uliginosibacterium sp. sgz301328 TaxID=3243764 RepID=UPI00359E6889